MFDRAKYINNKGEEVVFGENNIYINANDIRDYKWNYTEDNGFITLLKKGITQKTIPIVIVCATKSEGIQIKNTLFEIFDNDVLNGTMGKLEVSDYYLPCYVVESKKSNYLFHPGYLELTITILTDFAYWCKEYEKIFYASPKEIENIEDESKNNDILEGVKTVDFFPFDFPIDFNVVKKKLIGRKTMFGFPFDFKQNFNLKRFVNEHYTSCEFRLYIFGVCLNPSIFINSNLYEVKTTLSDGDYMVIDSRDKTIVKYGNNGNTMNCFNYRNKKSDIFKKIESGAVSVRWSAAFTFKLVILQERSEPPWK